MTSSPASAERVEGGTACQRVPPSAFADAQGMNPGPQLLALDQRRPSLEERSTHVSEVPETMQLHIVYKGFRVPAIAIVYKIGCARPKTRCSDGARTSAQSWNFPFLEIRKI